MVSGIPPVGVTQNGRLLSCDTVLLGVECIVTAGITMKLSLLSMMSYALRRVVPAVKSTLSILNINTTS
jgi:hypothetical protein